MESLYLLILLFFIVVLILPLGFRGKAFYSVKTNKGAFAIRLWRIPIKISKVKVKGKQIYIVEDKQVEENEVAISEPQLKFLQFFNDEVKDKVKLRSIDAYMRVGIDNPMIAGILSAGASDLILGFFANVKNRRPTASTHLTTHTSFTESSGILALRARASLSILDVIYSFIISILRTRSDRLIERKIQ